MPRDWRVYSFMSKGNEQPVTEGASVDWEVLARFMAGESPADEAAGVRAWLARNPARHDVLRALDGALAPLAAPPAGLDVDGALDRVHARMDAPGTPVVPFRARARATPPTRRSAPAPWLRAAAAVLLLLGVGLGWQALRARPAAVSYATGVGARDSLRLPDGTTVVLGPASRLTVAANYGRTARDVELRGEARFHVPHDPARPFTVHAGAAWVRDLGTAFSVRSDDGGGVRVVVTAGAVALRAADAAARDPIVLRQGERGTLAAGRTVAERAPATPDDLAWARGRLVFRDAPLDEVAAALRRGFGIVLVAEDPAVAERRLTASFGDEPPADVLRVIGLALGADVALRGDTAVLRAAPAAMP